MGDQQMTRPSLPSKSPGGERTRAHGAAPRPTRSPGSDLRAGLASAQQLLGNRGAGHWLAGRTRSASAPGGLPSPLRAGIEHLSGIAMDDVEVHYRSPKPRAMGALAYAEGRHIHLGPGEERHLPHEAWHIVQQKQGRVSPTRQNKDHDLNDDGALEHEATTMGERALRLGAGGVEPTGPLARGRVMPPVVQRKIGFELQTVGGKDNIKMYKGVGKGLWVTPPEKLHVYSGDGFHIETDNGGKDLEYISDAFDLNDRDLGRFVTAAREAAAFQASIVRGEHDTDIEVRNKHDDRLKLLKDGCSKAHPHVTVGVPFRYLKDFYDRLANAHERHWAGSSASMKRHMWLQERRAYQDSITALDTVLPDLGLKSSAAAAFLVNIVTMYRYAMMRDEEWQEKRRKQQELMERTHKRPKKILGERPTTSKPYPIKLRTSAAAIWKLIAEEDQEKIEELVFNHGEMTDLDRKVQTLFGAAQPWRGWLVFGTDSQNFGEWFTKISNGEEDPIGELRDDRPGPLEKYGMSSPTDVGLGDSGQIIELRALRRNIPYREWADYMMEVVGLLPRYMVKPSLELMEDDEDVEAPPPVVRSLSAPT